MAWTMKEQNLVTGDDSKKNVLLCMDESLDAMEIIKKFKDLRSWIHIEYM